MGLGLCQGSKLTYYLFTLVDELTVSKSICGGYAIDTWHSAYTETFAEVMPRVNIKLPSFIAYCNLRVFNNSIV